MKNTYIINCSKFRIAIGDLHEFEDGFWITRLNVPLEFRGQGFGRQLINLILSDADKFGATLYLQVSSSGELDNTDISKWYSRNGFVESSLETFQIRRPKTR